METSVPSMWVLKVLFRYVHRFSLKPFTVKVTAGRQCIFCGSVLSLVQTFFSFFLGIVMYANEFETKKNKIWTKDKIKPQHIYMSWYRQTVHGPDWWTSIKMSIHRIFNMERTLNWKEQVFHLFYVLFVCRANKAQISQLALWFLTG